ncbi:hypothetical protein [Bradyrhizobium liaoningense]|uniref:hypothetical protein n=1 Tax=Bradyrhizobium liaoningense TaxID=43992 RepID=UPI001BACFE4C|nr:hypothetical protein [Bradyrhizobium liaoningense]MBR0855453.1 hypothetical protein [Bradyrhizobium liaoningense]
MSRKDSRALQSTAEVIEALGGLRAVSVLTGAAYKLVSGWGKAKNFPSRYFLVMTWALRRKRLSAHPSLWGQVTTPEMEKAAA